jgi:HD-GYP domain-containing protein (c-di-GMP phosphodiesterase class II)
MTEIDTYGEIGRIVAQLTAAVTNTGLYSITHPQVGQYVEKAHAALTALLAVKPEVTLMLIGNDLVAESRPLPADNASVSNFVKIIHRRGLERVTFLSGLPKSELSEFIRSLATSDVAAIRSTSCIKIGKVELRVKSAAGQVPGVAEGEGGPSGVEAPPEMMEELRLLSASELDDLKTLYLNIKKHRQLDMRSVEEVVRLFIRGFREELSPLKLLATVKSAHEYTFTHVTNVGVLTMAQAESLGFTGDHLHQIGVASLLHDVGKLFIPEEILNKKDKLDHEERKIVETHTTKGARHLLGMDGIPKLAVVAALEHHLKYDGTGYPSIKGKWTPNIASQMISVADVFDAMRSRRVYQEPQPLSKIRQVLVNGKGTAFNPVLVDHFLKLTRL